MGVRIETQGKPRWAGKKRHPEEIGTDSIEAGHAVRPEVPNRGNLCGRRDGCAAVLKDISSRTWLSALQWVFESCGAGGLRRCCSAAAKRPCGHPLPSFRPAAALGRREAPWSAVIHHRFRLAWPCRPTQSADPSAQSKCWRVLLRASACGSPQSFVEESERPPKANPPAP